MVSCVNLTDKAVKVEVEEITQPDTDAYLIAENIAGQLTAPYFSWSGDETCYYAGDAPRCGRYSH